MLRDHVSLDVAEAHTSGADRTEAPARAVDALETAVPGYRMRTARADTTEPARRWDRHRPHVDRLLNLRRSPRLDRIEAAFRAWGEESSVRVSGAA